MLETWNLDDAIKLIGAIHGDVVRCGYFVTLGGGVLVKGKSDRDLDLYFLPIEGKYVRADQESLIELLTKLWGSFDKISFDSMGREARGPRTAKEEREAQVYEARGMVPPWQMDQEPNVMARRLGQAVPQAQPYRRGQVRGAAPVPPDQVANIIQEQINEPPVADEYNPGDDENQREYQEQIRRQADELWREMNRPVQPGSVRTSVGRGESNYFRYRLKFNREDGRIDAYIV